MYERYDLEKDYFARSYRLGDEEGIVELLQLVFKGWPHIDLSCSPLDHWRWKFEDNPIQKRFITVAEIENKIIGCLHIIPLRIKIGDDVYLCSTSVDFAVHPDFRERGVSRKVANLSSEKRRDGGVNLDYHITGNPILIKGLLKDRPHFPYNVVNLVRINVVNLVRIRDINKQLEIMPVENAWLKKYGYYLIKIFNDFKNALKGKPMKHDLSIHKIDRFSENINEFGKAVSGHYKIIVERSRDYLNWRYCDHRAGDFTIKQAEEGGRILGYSVLRINRYRRDYPVGFIVDLLTLPDRLDAADALAADAVHFFDDSDINIVNYQVVRGHPYEEVLKRHGFVKCSYPGETTTSSPLKYPFKNRRSITRGFISRAGSSKLALAANIFNTLM